MEFSEREITDLAAFFAKRFPSYEQRAALAEAAGLAGEAQLTGDAGTVWNDVVRVAVQKGKLNDLVERAVQQRPDDENLREMAGVIGGGGRWRKRRWGLAVGVVVLAAGGLLIWSPWSGDSPAPAPEPDNDAVAMVEPEPEVLRTVPEPEVPQTVPEPEVLQNVPEPEVLPTVPGPEPEVPQTVPEPEPGPARATPEDSPSSPKASPRPSGAPLRCEGPPGEIIGYWYAGETAPPKGSSFTVDGGINVRVDYPGHHNAYNARAALVCTLGHGWELRLGNEPVEVPGGAYWVPLAADDIVSR